MQHGHDHFKRRATFLLVHIHRNPPAVVLYRDAVTGQDAHFNSAAMTCKCLIYGVVNHLINQVVKTFNANVADIHGRSFPDGLESFQNLNIIGGIILLRLGNNGLFAHKLLVISK